MRLQSSLGRALEICFQKVHSCDSWLEFSILQASQGLLSVLKTWRVASPQVSWERERERWSVLKTEATVPFIHLILEGTDHYFYHILHVTWAYPATAWEEAIQNFMNSRRWGPLGVILWRLSYHVCCWSGKISFKKKSIMLGQVSWYILLLLFVFLRDTKWKSRSEVVKVHVCVPKSQAWGPFYSFLSSVQAKSWHLRGTDWSLADFWDWMNSLNLGKTRDPVQGKTPSCLSAEGDTDQAPGAGIWGGDLLSVEHPGNTSKPWCLFSPHFPQRKGIQCSAAGKALPLVSSIWDLGLVLAKWYACSKFKFLNVTKWLG